MAAKYQELVEKLVGLRRFGIKPGLDRMHRALAREDSPQRCFDVITVAGTNGKGTVASLIAAILQGHGHRVGLYTSPHLIDIRERFRVNGQPLSQSSVEPVLRRYVSEYGEATNADELVLTFFELTTLAAVKLFALQEVDFAVFEVGLGGRLDAVNALDPVLSVVTTIGHDHTEYLGDNISAIAREKAGIFRSGVPAVVGVQESLLARQALVDAARDKQVDLVCGGSALEIGTADDDLEARHRATATDAVQCLLGDAFRQEAQQRGIRGWQWPGRAHEWAVDDGERRLMIDAAHNRAGLDALRGMLKRRVAPIEAVIWGSMADKEPGPIRSFFEALGVPVWGSEVANPRARTAAELRAFVPPPQWREAGSTAYCLERSLAQVSGDVLVFGSVYLVGEVFEALDVTPAALCTYIAD